MSNRESSTLLEQEHVVILGPPRSRCRSCCLRMCLCLLCVLGLGLGVVAALAAGPLHAQCSVRWTFSIPCKNVSSSLVGQIEKWTTDDCPGKSQKCLYALVSVEDDDIVATHTTPVMKYVDDIEFTFNSSETENCAVLGRSVSRTWYAILDSGTNYLNMYNLVNGSGLISTPGFHEFASDRNCTQYSTAKEHLDLLINL